MYGNSFFRIFAIVYYDILILTRKYSLLLHIFYSSISLCLFDQIPKLVLSYSAFIGLRIQHLRFSRVPILEKLPNHHRSCYIHEFCENNYDPL